MPSDPVNPPPRRDGDINIYRDSANIPHRHWPYGTRPRRLLWINGMLNPAQSHLDHALTLSRIIEGEVVGVYNQTGGISISLERFLACVQNSRLFAGQYIGHDPIEVEPPDLPQAPAPVQQAANAIGGVLRSAGAKPPPKPPKIKIEFPKVPVKDVVVWMLRYAQFGTQPFDILQQVLAPNAPIGDLPQCIADWLNNIFLACLDAKITLRPQAPPLMPQEDFDRLLRLRNFQNPSIPMGGYFRANARDLISLLLAENAATLALFEFLAVEAWRWPAPQIVLVSHSQGNLVASDALLGFKVLCQAQRAPFPPRPMTVFAVASPSVFWPLGVTMNYYSHADDRVTWLSLGRSYDKRRNSPGGEIVFTTSGSYLPPTDKQTLKSHHFCNYASEASGDDRLAPQTPIGTSKLAKDLRRAVGYPDVPPPELLMSAASNLQRAPARTLARRP